MKTISLTPKAIIETLEKHQDEMRRYSVKRIGLFGSFAKGTPHKKSDMDFIVKLAKPSFDNYMELKFFLERVFRRKVDLVTEEGLKPSLHYVKKEAVYAA